MMKAENIKIEKPDSPDLRDAGKYWFGIYDENGGTGKPFGFIEKSELIKLRDKINKILDN